MTPRAAAAWPGLVRRFSSLAAAAVGALVLSALPLTWTYAGSWQGLVGTGYGSLVVTKARSSWRSWRSRSRTAARCARRRLRWQRRPPRASAAARRGGDDRPRHRPLRRRQPVRPAARRGPAGRRHGHGRRGRRGVPPQDSRRSACPRSRPCGRAAPRWPRAGSARARPTSGRTSATTWPASSCSARACSPSPRSRRGTGWDRHWPLGLVALAAFVYLRAAANEGAWPFGPTALWHVDAEALQHRMAAGLVLALGLIEWRARARPRPGCRAALPPARARRRGRRAAPHALPRRLPEQGELPRAGHPLDDGRPRRAAGRGALARDPAEPARQPLGRDRRPAWPWWASRSSSSSTRRRTSRSTPEPVRAVSRNRLAGWRVHLSMFRMATMQSAARGVIRAANTTGRGLRRLGIETVSLDERCSSRRRAGRRVSRISAATSSASRCSWSSKVWRRRRGSRCSAASWLAAI